MTGNSFTDLLFLFYVHNDNQNETEFSILFALIANDNVFLIRYMNVYNNHNHIYITVITIENRKCRFYLNSSRKFQINTD